MESMTGYAYLEDQTQQFSFTVELKTLNSKYQEQYVNVPRLLRYEENEMVTLLKRSFARGKAELTVDIGEWTESREVQVNTELIERYYTALKEIERRLNPEKSFSLDTLLQFDGVLMKERSVITEQSRKKIYQSIEQVCKTAQTMRRQEGKAVLNDIEESLHTISDSLSEIRKLAAFDSREQFDRLRKRLADAGCSSCDETRLYTEIALLADKLDINEETSRLKDHITKFKQMVKTNGPHGKQLDFLSQEMFREINTIAAKSGRSDISHLVVTVKNNIDKIREQCRNIV